MQIKTKIFDRNTEVAFVVASIAVWLSKKKTATLGITDTDLQTPVFVKVHSNDTLKKFTFYAKLEVLNPKSDLDEDLLYIPKDLFHKSWGYEDGMVVELERLDVESLTQAEVVTIKLNEGDVKLWSEDEAEISKRKYLLNAGVTFVNQMTWLNPSTKTYALGEVVHIYPKTNSILDACAITKDTKVILEGLSGNKQKIIDFQKIGGLSDVINKLREIIQIPITYPDLLNKFNIKPPKGMLMYGPPGNGKTMIARAVAQSMGSNFITIDLTDATSKYTGVAEQKLKEKFEVASAKGNCVIFIDEIDSIASKRGEDTPEHQIKVVSSLLTLMDGLGTNNGVFVIGATNRLNAIDPALRRPGRFDLEFEVPLPDQNARLDILSKYVNVKDKSILKEDLNIDFLRVLSELTTGYSGADLSLLYRESVMNTIREYITIDKETGKIQLLTNKDEIKISKHNFSNAMKFIKPTSLRSSEQNLNTVLWSDLLAFDKLKSILINTHNNVEKQYRRSELSNRKEFANIVFIGKKGSGKRTLLYSFAKEYKYEVLTIDILDLFSLSLAEAGKEIESYFIKAKQISPSIINIRNAEKISRNEFYLFKILNELEKLTNRNRIIAVIHFESNEKVPEIILGYKSFANIVDFQQLTDFGSLRVENENLKKKLQKMEITIGAYLNSRKNEI